MKKYLKIIFIIGMLSLTMVVIACQDRRALPHHKKILLDVPIIAQKPELDNGCEVTSLAMLLQYAGVDVDKMALAEEIRKDDTPVVYDEAGSIQSWGNPEKGFVGDITGNQIGFGVYTGPVLELLNQYLSGRGKDLSGQPFEALLEKIDEGKPVIVWVTSEFEVPEEFTEWESGSGTIKITFDEHAVLLVGYDDTFCYINNPYNGKKNQQVNKENFTEVWDSMGSMAISYK